MTIYLRNGDYTFYSEFGANRGYKISIDFFDSVRRRRRYLLLIRGTVQKKLILKRDNGMTLTVTLTRDRS